MDGNFQTMERTAAEGDPLAQFELAEAFRMGEAVQQDYDKALTWYLAAAEQGLALAQNNLGTMYLGGLGTPKDPATAAVWYERAAVQGDSVAQFNLAMRYLRGSGVAADETAAAKWLALSAEQGYVEAIGELGTMYRFGRGVPKNIVAAAELHVIAALDGDHASAEELRQYRSDLELEALQGSALAALCLAKIYDRGLGARKSQPKMLAWLSWGQNHGLRDNHADVLSEIDSYAGFWAMVLTAEVKEKSRQYTDRLQSRKS